MPELYKIKVHSWDDSETTDIKPMDYWMGIHYVEGGQKPKIHLFTVRGDEFKCEGDPVSLDRSIYKVCSGIVEDYFSGKKINDFDWELTAAGGHTKLNFEEKNGWITGVRCTNAFPLYQSSFAYGIKDYEEALEDPDNFLHILSEGHPKGFENHPEYLVIVPLPLHPDGHIILETGLSTYKSDKYEVVFADAQKLRDLIIGQEMKKRSASFDDLIRIYEDEPLKGDDVAFPPFHSTIEESIKHLNPGLGYPGEIAIANFSTDGAFDDEDWGEGLDWRRDNEWMLSERIGFQNGRHRTFNMINTGAPFIPILMGKSLGTEMFKERYGWSKQPQPAPAPRFPQASP